VANSAPVKPVGGGVSTIGQVVPSVGSSQVFEYAYLKLFASIIITLKNPNGESSVSDYNFILVGQ
jgi:hypothetical protein